MLRRELDRIDRACSRFRDDSELARLNRAAGQAVAVSRAARRGRRGRPAGRRASPTGTSTPPSGRAMGALGYDRDFSTAGRGAPPGSACAIAPVPGWRTVRLDRARAHRRGPARASGSTSAPPRRRSPPTAAAARRPRGDRRRARSSASAATSRCAAQAPRRRLAGAGDRRPPRRPDGAGETIGCATGGLATSSTTVRRWRAGPDRATTSSTRGPARPRAEVVAHGQRRGRDLRRRQHRQHRRDRARRARPGLARRARAPGAPGRPRRRGRRASAGWPEPAR